MDASNYLAYSTGPFRSTHYVDSLDEKKSPN